MNKNKNQFCEILKHLEKRSIQQSKLMDDIGLSEDSPLRENYEYSEQELMHCLSIISGDKEDWVSHYVYETDFGKNEYAKKISYKGKRVPFKTPEQVWDCIQKIK